MDRAGSKSPPRPPSLGRMALLGLLGCGGGIGLLGGMTGFHEGGIGRAVVGFLIGAGVGALIGLVTSPVVYLFAVSGYETAARIRRQGKRR